MTLLNRTVAARSSLRRARDGVPPRGAVDPVALALLVVLSVWLPRSASATPATWGAEAAVAAPLTAPQTREFGLGATLALDGMLPLAEPVSVGMRGRLLGLLNDGGALAEGRQDKGFGGLFSGAFLFRLHPLSVSAGPYVDAGFGLGVTGPDLRAVAELGIGYLFEWPGLSLGPHIGYLQIVQPEQTLEPADARLLLVGIAARLQDSERTRPAPPAVSSEPLALPDHDSDGDGLSDAGDACPGFAEDRDGFSDWDGCPDPDNDEDGLLDGDDGCPDDAEDVDGWEDTDGCPDLDNDGDGVPDAIDACPDEPEVENGEADDDGCPDDGVIEFDGDRVVLEERVLFDRDRARVRHAGWPALEAIVALARRHPEWARIRIEGHADRSGNEAWNLELSERRARNVMRKLRELGLPPVMMEAVGLGASRPLDGGEGEDAQRRNRRVEFVVVARSQPAGALVDAEVVPVLPPRQMAPSASLVIGDSEPDEPAAKATPVEEATAGPAPVAPIPPPPPPLPLDLAPPPSAEGAP